MNRQVHFDGLYARSDDPWDYRTSPYESSKYDRTLAALDRPYYGSVLEIGCSNGEFAARMATRCRRLLALDLSARAVAVARKRLARHPHAEVRRATIPRDWPDDTYDLIVFSEVLYYLDLPELRACAEHSAISLASPGEIVLVNWTGATDTPLSGKEASSAFVNSLVRHRKFGVRSEAHFGYDLLHLSEKDP